MYIKKPILVIGVIVLILTTVFLTIGAVNPFGFTAFRDLLHFQYVSRVIMDTYYEDISPNSYMQYALEGMANGTEDPYTTYLWGEKALEYKEKIHGNYKGIGVRVICNVEDDTIEVVSVVPGSPAESAEIAAGDKILKVDGEAFTGLQLDEAVSKIRGAGDTEVLLTILKKKSGDTVEISLKRQEFDINVVSGRMLQNDIGMIKIEEFTDDSATKFKEKYDELKNNGMKKLILDLRNNPGGLLDEAVDIADIFLEEGNVVVYTLDRDENKKEYFASGTKEEIPLVILTNNGSASASEVVTGCLKDYGIAYHIGEKTYGKGVVQGVFETGGETLLSVTVSRYYTPNGTCIHKTGIVPDLEVSLPEMQNSNNLSAEEDAQLQAAIQYLRR